MKALFSCGKDFVAQKIPGNCTKGTVSENRVVLSEETLPIDQKIVNVYETNDPFTLEQGNVFLTEDGNALFHAFSDSFDKLTQISIPVSDPNHFVIFPDETMLTIEDSNVSVYDNELNQILNKEVPVDSYFACFSPLQALLVSPSENIMILIEYNSLKDISFIDLPGGFSNLTHAAIFDDTSFVFTRNDETVHLYSHTDNTLKSIKFSGDVQRITTAELDTFESICIILTTDQILHYVRFDSKTVTEVASNIENFCVVHSPFDVVVASDRRDRLLIINEKSNKQLEKSVYSMIDALNSVVATSLSSVSNTRERLGFRKLLSSSTDFELPPMITLFGEETGKKEEKKQENTEQKYWIENVSGNIKFEIHSDEPIPPDSNVIVSSGAAAFESRISFEQSDLRCIFVEFFVNVESISAVEHFQVFLKDENTTHFVGEIIIPIDVLLSSNEIPRIVKVYNVAFNSKSFQCIAPSISALSQGGLQQNTKMQIKEIDDGVNIKIIADTCEHFTQRLISASTLVPEGATFIPVDEQKKHFEAAHNLARSVSMFLQIAENDSLEKSMLLTLKSDIDEYFSAMND